MKVIKQSTTLKPQAQADALKRRRLTLGVKVRSGVRAGYGAGRPSPYFSDAWNA